MITVGAVTGFMSTILGIINANWWTRGAAGFLVILGAWKVNNTIVGKQAVSRHVEKSVRTGEQINARNRTKRTQILATPGSAKRLPCRDC